MPGSDRSVVSQRECFRVGWIDTDASGRIHHTAVFRWAEATEVALYRRLRLLDAPIDRWPRRQVEAEYRRALGFDDEVEVHLEVASLGTSSVTFGWRITHDGETAVTGRHTVVQVDGDGQPLPLADATRAALVHGAPLAGVA